MVNPFAVNQLYINIMLLEGFKVSLYYVYFDSPGSIQGAFFFFYFYLDFTDPVWDGGGGRPPGYVWFWTRLTRSSPTTTIRKSFSYNLHLLIYLHCTALYNFYHDVHICTYYFQISMFPLYNYNHYVPILLHLYVHYTVQLESWATHFLCTHSFTINFIVSVLTLSNLYKSYLTICFFVSSIIKSHAVHKYHVHCTCLCKVS